MPTETEHIVLVMSERAPVRVARKDWPLIASARHEFAAFIWEINVRRHSDGRCIVYGHQLLAGPNKTTLNHAGYMVEPSVKPKLANPLVKHDTMMATVRAIRRVAGVINCSSLADRCIANLPPEVLS